MVGKSRRRIWVSLVASPPWKVTNNGSPNCSAEQLGLPLFVTFHGGDATKETHIRRRLFPTIYQRRRKALLARAKAFLCVSDFVARRLQAQGFPEDKLRTHYIGLDLASMAMLAKSRPM